MLKQRVITALILAPIVLAGLFLLEPLAFAWFVAVVVLLGAWEWANFAGISAQKGRMVYALVVAAVLYLSSGIPAIWVLSAGVLWWLLAVALVASYPDRLAGWKSPRMIALMGLFVLVPFWKAMVLVRSSSLQLAPDFSVLWVILYMLFLVWAADIGAYFAGKAWGRRKLAPNVSPGKSWAGAWGGVASVVLLAIIAGSLVSLALSDLLWLIVASSVTAAISIYGDLLESMLKRHRGIKDSSQLLPGHGGVMDRIDSLTAAIPVFTSLALIFGWLA